MARGIRRPAPSPLLLVPAGSIARGTPKHKLPSIPVPSFQPAAQLPKRMSHTQLPPLRTDASGMLQISPQQYSSSHKSSSESERGWPWNLRFYKTRSASSSTSSLSSISSSDSESRVHPRAPWDYSASVQFDMESLLAVPKPVAINP